MPQWLDQDEQRVWRLYLSMSRRLNEVMDRCSQEEAGVPVTYYVVLAMLSEAPGGRLRMSELAEATDSSPSRLSHAVTRLAERGWVSREKASDDGRGQVAVLLAEGRKALEAMAPGHAAVVRRYVFDQITREQLAALEAICVTVLDELDAEQQSS